MNMMEILQTLTSMIKTNVTKEYGIAKDNSHTHDNKDALDTINEAQIYAWGKGAEHAGDVTVHVTSEEKTQITNMITQSSNFAKGQGLTFFVDSNDILNVQYEEEE